MAVAAFNSVSFVGLNKSEAHLLFGSGFGFPSTRLSVSFKAFKPMAAVAAVPAVGLSETFDKLRKQGQVCVFHSCVFPFCFGLFFFPGCLFVICLDGKKMGEKNGGV